MALRSLVLALPFLVNTLDRLLELDVALGSKSEKRPASLKQPRERLLLRLKNGRSQALDDDNGVNKLSETSETVKLAKNVFLPFFCEVLFEKGYAGKVHGLAGATVKKLGLGSAERASFERKWL